jgi:ankyrin repeat protein
MTAHTELDKERIDFHHKITKCGGHKDRIKVIKAVLKHYPWLVNSTDGMERTPLHLAAKRGDVILGEVLFQCGADLNAKDLNGNSVLQFAIEQNEEDFVIFLLDNNVKVDKRTMSKEIRYRLEEIQSLAEL